MLVLSRKEAMSINAPFYNTGKPCKNGHVSDRYTSSGHCLSCKADWESKNHEKVDSYKQSWAQRNPEAVRESVSTYYRRNTDERRAYSAQHYLQNREDRLAKQKVYRQENPEIYTAAKQRRRAIELRALPAWANHDLIKEKFALAQQLSAETGIPHEVDHIIPLRGRNVCGLHREDNLQVIPASENRKKNNKFEVN